MTIKEFQELVAATLNADAWLRQRDCMAFAENALDAESAVATHMQGGGIAIIVLTPEAENLTGDAAPKRVRFRPLSIRADEKPGVNRLQAEHCTALDAAWRAVFLLERPQCLFLRIRQSADDHAGVLSAEAQFDTTATITDPASQQQQTKPQE
jgi:hypothetical protein